MEVSAKCFAQQESPPSVYAIAAWVDGEPGATMRVVGLTLERAAFIGMGLWLAGIRGSDLVAGSLAASATVSAWIAADLASRQQGGDGLTPFSE